MTNWVHPSIFFIFGAFLIPFLKGKVQKGYMLLLAFLALAFVAMAAPGTYGVYEFLGQEIIFGKVDALSLVFGYIFTIMAIIGVIYALHLEDAGQHMAAFFYIGSALGVVFAGDYFSLFIFWEIMAFASAYLVFAQREKASVDAGYRYILVHVLGGVCLMAGFIIHYGDTGSFLFGPIEPNGSMAFYLILLGFIINAAVPPFNAWLPDAYPAATVTGAVFMSAFTTKTAVYTLIRAFPGTELLVVLGVVMALYGVIYAMLENDIRRVLAYSIISQVGYLVAGIGMGSELALNGAVSHAFNDILFKSLMFMATGAVIYVTGKKKLTELGGLHKTMPVTLVLYMVGAFAVSAVPLFSGFVSKSMIVSAAHHDHRMFVTLLLTVASAGTFLYTSLRLPYYMFFGKDSGLAAKEPPSNMLLAMGIAAFFCVGIGIFPNVLYGLLPYDVHYHPYTSDHITGALSMILAAAVGFIVFRRHLEPAPTQTLDTDWFYRKGSMVFMRFARGPIGIYEGFITEVTNTVILPSIYSLAAIGMWIDRTVVDGAVNGVAKVVMSLSASVRRMQSGLLQHYAVGMVVGILVIVLIYSLMGGG